MGRVSSTVFGDEPSSWVSQSVGSIGEGPADASGQWFLTHYSAGDLANPAKRTTLWDHGVDSDLDGLGILLECHMGLTPTAHEVEEEFSIVPGATASTLTFRRGEGIAGVNLQLLYSDDGMATWKTLGITPNVLEDFTTWERVGADVPLGFQSEDRIFFKLEATR
ncbi:MAG: hypothetical protein ACI8T1_001833 [Verrucomicrobiales bacterium]